MIREFAPAKINLSLHITGKRTDGYHTLNSIIAFTDIGDEVILEPADGFFFKVEGPKDIENENNLVVKAARLMAEKFGKDLNCKITLVKNLPIASGIGGGSADAAATLRAFSKFWGIDEDISDIALKLGADVPVCLKTKAQYVTGIGENLQDIQIPAFSIILINPNISCATANVFSKFKQSYKSEMPAPQKIDLRFLQTQENDLTTAACEIVPQIENILKILKNAQLARLSGSGATCYGLFENAGNAQTAAEKIQQENPNWWVKVGKLIS